MKAGMLLECKQSVKKWAKKWKMGITIKLQSQFSPIKIIDVVQFQTTKFVDPISEIPMLPKIGTVYNLYALVALYM